MPLSEVSTENSLFLTINRLAPFLVTCAALTGPLLPPLPPSVLTSRVLIKARPSRQCNPKRAPSPGQRPAQPAAQAAPLAPSPTEQSLWICLARDPGTMLGPLHPAGTAVRRAACTAGYGTEAGQAGFLLWASRRAACAHIRRQIYARQELRAPLGPHNASRVQVAAGSDTRCTQQTLSITPSLPLCFFFLPLNLSQGSRLLCRQAFVSNPFSLRRSFGAFLALGGEGSLLPLWGRKGNCADSSVLLLLSLTVLNFPGVFGRREATSTGNV